MTRILTRYVIGSLISRAIAQMSGVTVYGENESPDVTSANKWAQIFVEFTDTPSRDSDWIGEGRMLADINARESLNNIYTAPAIAEDFTTVFRSNVTITDGSSTKGVAVFDTKPVSRPIGTTDGIQAYYWECSFKVYTST